METYNIQKENTPILPALVKQSSTYKIIIPRKVEEKIRYLCRKFPTLEWSGVLFTRHTGTFENNDLVIHCEDIYPMDLGSPGFTQFKMDETVAAYMADNLELLDCDIQLIHSHNTMAAFFSGTDTNTLREEGNDRNCFVSLIVNNAGTYCAAITRKIQLKKEVVTKDLGSSYQFFGSGTVAIGEDSMSEKTEVIDKEVIEYFMLDVEVEQVDNPLSYLDTRFNEIEAKKKSSVIPAKPITTTGYSRVYDPKKGDTVLIPDAGNDFDKDKDFFDWIHKEEKKEPKQLTLFEGNDFTPDPELIHTAVCRLVLCSLNFQPKNFDLKQWITKYLDNVYEKIFKEGSFDAWCDFAVEYFVTDYISIEDVDDPDAVYAAVAGAMIDELTEYSNNYYIMNYCDALQRYLDYE